MNTLTKTSIVLLLLSVGAFFWGNWYMDSHPFIGMGVAFGMSDTTYTIAKAAVYLGLLGFILGVGLLIAGLVRKGS